MVIYFIKVVLVLSYFKPYKVYLRAINDSYEIYIFYIGTMKRVF